MSAATVGPAQVLEAVTGLKDELTTVKKSLADSQKELAEIKASPVYKTAGIYAEPRDPKVAASGGFKNDREFLNAVLKSYQHHTEEMDPRLIQWFEPNVRKGMKPGLITKAVGSDEARVISDPAGGFLVPPTFINDLLKIDPEDDPIGGRTRKIPMATPTVKIPARSDKTHTSSVAGGLTVGRRAETTAAIASQMTLEQVVLDAHMLMGLSYASEELLNDSAISFSAILSTGFSDQFIYALIKERLYGSGNGEFLGILTALDASSLGPTVSIAKESSQVAATINYTNVVKMRAQCWGYNKAVWLANHDAYVQLSALSLPIGIAGTAMYTPSLREDRPDMLLGRPIIYTEYCKTIGTQGDLVLANWDEYLEGTYQPLQQDESVHVRFVNHERTFKFWMRNAGCPWWKVAITPAYSSVKLSPFIVLDTRA